MGYIRPLTLAFFAALASPSVLGDEWVVNRLRGQAEHYDGRQWHPLAIGDTIKASRHVRTHHRSRMELVRGDEVLDLAPATFLAIHEAAGRKMTTVEQSLGSVSVQAEKRDVQHFEVRTPLLAAVVKGTAFSVTIKDGRTEVDVRSGMVAVEDTTNDISADVGAGQSALSGETGALLVTGPGSQDTVYLVRGIAVPASEVEQVTGLRQATDPTPSLSETSISQSESSSSDNSATTLPTTPRPSPVVAPPVATAPTPSPPESPSGESDEAAEDEEETEAEEPEEPEEEEEEEEEEDDEEEEED